MGRYRHDIMALCSKVERKALELFCQTINESMADVFVVMAHKAAHLFHVLIDQEYITPAVKEKVIVSHEALDFNCNYITNKRVAIVDDIIISGTTIASTVRKLIDCGVSVSDIEIIALAKDVDYFTMNFSLKAGVSILKCKTLLDDANCIALSSAISEFFTNYAISYNVDFPNYSEFETTSDNIGLMYNDFMWELKRISGNTNTEEYTLFPRPVMLNILWEQLGVNLDNCANLKVRIFLEYRPNRRIKVHLIPMCLFKGLSVSSLNCLYDHFLPQGIELKLRADSRPIAKLRYVQFYVAHHVFKLFQELSSFCDNVVILHKSTLLLFGETDGRKIRDIIDVLPSYSPLAAAIECTVCNDESVIVDKNYGNERALIDSFHGMCADIQKKGIAQSDYPEFQINTILIAPFLWWYDKKEVPVRRKIWSQNVHFISDWENINKSVTRLNNGFPLQTLQRIYGETLADYNSEEIISLFIDLAVDKGIIVPTIYYSENENFISRAYRHGEDLPFAIADQCRLVHFIKNLCNRISDLDAEKDKNCAGIAEVSMEKMIVLFYQMGLQKNIFNRFLGFDNISLMKPFLSVHGVVSAYIDKDHIKDAHMYSEMDDERNRYITWLSTWLYDHGILLKSINSRDNDEDKHVFQVSKTAIEKFLRDNERSCISSEIECDISHIANVLAVWYNHMAEIEKKDVFKVDAVALSSCADPYVYTYAIATEVHYFSKFWKLQAKKALEKAHSFNTLQNSFIPETFEREQYEKTGTALHSGREKVEWYNDKRAKKVVNYVDNILENHNLDKEFSKSWPDANALDISSLENIRDYLNQATGFLYFYSAFMNFFLDELFWTQGRVSTNYKKYEQKYEDICEKTPLLRKDCFERLNRISCMETFEEKKTALQQLMRGVIRDSEDVVEYIDNISRSHIEGHSYTVRYNSALVFDVKAFMPSEIDKIVMSVWYQLKEDKTKTCINIVRFQTDEADSQFDRIGVFYVSELANENEIDNRAEVLLDLYSKLCRAFNARAYEIRAIVMPELPPGRLFVHNLDRNLRESAENFSHKVVRTLTDAYNKDAKMQMIAASGDYTNEVTFNQRVKNIGWDNDCVSDSSLDNPNFRDVRIYYNSYESVPSTDKKDPTYSTVWITCGSQNGAGLLVKLKNCVVCVTCNHILAECNESKPIAESDGMQHITFGLSLTDEYKKYPNDNLLSALDETVILIPEWENNIPYDISSILELDDLEYCVEKHSGQDTYCYGRIKGATPHWRHAGTIVGSQGIGYVQMGIENYDRTVDNGFSGGLVRTESNNVLIGIHEGSMGQHMGRLIPCRIIKEKIERMIHDGKM